MISAVLLWVCNACASHLDAGVQSPVRAFTAAYMSHDAPAGEALARREAGLCTILRAMRRRYGASADSHGGGCTKKNVDHILGQLAELGLVAPLVSFGDQLEGLADAQRAVAADLARLLLSVQFFSSRNSLFLRPDIYGRRVSTFDKALRFVSEVACYCGTLGTLPGGGVHHGNKYWYREVLRTAIRAKETYYDALIGFHPENRDHSHGLLRKCIQGIRVLDVIDDIVGFGLVCFAVDVNSGSSMRFTVYETLVTDLIYRE